MRLTRALIMGGRLLPELVSFGTGTQAAGTTLVITAPAGIVDGYVMVASMSANAVAARTWTGGTGWTEFVDQGADPSVRSAYKVCASEAGNYTFTTTVSGALQGMIVLYKRAAIDAVSSAVSTLAGTGGLATAGITPANAGRLLNFVHTRGAAASHAAPSRMTLIGSIAGSGGLVSAFEGPANAGATGTITSTIGGASTTSGGVLAALKAG